MTDEMRVDLAELEEFINALGAVPYFLGREVWGTMKASLDVIQAHVDGRTPTNTGALRGATATEIRGSPLNLHGMVANPLLYGEPVERGRQPGKMPPVDAIELWVIRKLGMEPPESGRVAFLIARHIGRHGTEGAHMFAEGFDAAMPAVIGLWEKLPDKLIKALGGR